MDSSAAAQIENLFKTEGKRLYNLAYRICGDPDLAQDLLQESLIEIYRAFPKFRGESSTFTWAYKITLRRCRRYIRDRNVEHDARVSLQLTERSRARDQHADANARFDPADELVERAMVAEIREKCHYFMMFKLTELQRVTLLLQDLFEFSYKDTAYLLDTTEDVVRSRLVRARDNLRRHFSERCSWIKPGNPCICETRADHVLKMYPSLARTLARRTTRPEYNRLVAQQIQRRIDTESDIVSSFPMLDFKGRVTLRKVIENSEQP